MRTARTELRRFRAGDLDALCELEGDAEVVRTTGLRTVRSRGETEARLGSQIAREQALAPLGFWGAFLPDGSLACWLMLVPTEFAWPELGFMVPRRLWGQGFATECAGALVRHAEELGYRELFAVCDRSNAGSRRVLEKLGFAFEGEKPGEIPGVVLRRR